MFENITRMLDDDDSDPEDESEDWEWQEESADPGELPPDGDGGELVDGGEGGDDGTDIDELDVRLDELEEEVDSTASSLRALRDSQEEMAGSIEEMNDTVRQLVGVYDRLAAEENPFIDDPGDTADESAASPIPEVDGGETRSIIDEGASNDRKTEGESVADGTSDDETVVSFDDLREPTDGHQSGTSENPVETAPGDESSNGHDTDREGPSDRGDVSGSTPTSAADGPPVLVSVPDGYAGDVLLMEWLATLMDRSGPAGALRAVNHYEDVGWISSPVKDRLVDVIGGPGLDVFVDPTRPCEPTADEHAVSHEYLRVIDRLTEV